MRLYAVIFGLFLMIGCSQCKTSQSQPLGMAARFQIPVCTIPNICKVLPWCCGNFTNFPAVLHQVFQGNMTQLQNSPAFFIPFRVNVSSRRIAAKPTVSAINDMSGDFRRAGNRFGSSHSQYNSFGNYEDGGFDGNYGRSHHAWNNFGANRFRSNRYSVDNFGGNYQSYGRRGGFRDY